MRVPDSWWRGRIKSWKLNSRRWRTKLNPNLSPPSLLLRPKWHNWRNNLTRRAGKSFIISKDFKLGCVDPTKGWQGGPQKVNRNLKSCENKLWIYSVCLYIYRERDFFSFLFPKKSYQHSWWSIESQSFKNMTICHHIIFSSCLVLLVCNWCFFLMQRKAKHSKGSSPEG